MSEFISALVGAIVGAVAAFGFEAYRDHRKTKEDRYGAIIRTQFALIGQLNTMSIIKSQHLDAFRDDPNRAAKLLHFDYTKSALLISFESIAFLLIDHPNLVMAVHNAERSYVSAMECVDKRNAAYDELHRNSVLQSMDETGRCTIGIKDPRPIKLLKDTTDHLYVSVDRASERASKQIEELRKVGKALFPELKFLALEDAERTV